MNYVTEFFKLALFGWKSKVITNLGSTPQLIRNTSGKFGGYFIYNPNASVAYLQIYDASAIASVTVGTTEPIARFGIPTTAGANLELHRGLAASSGIVIAATTTPTGSTGPSSGLEITAYHGD